MRRIARHGLPVLLTALAFLAFADASSASRAYIGAARCCSPDFVVTGPTVGLVYQAAPGELNRVEVRIAAGRYVIRDTGATIRPAGFCERGADRHEVTCASVYSDGDPVLIHVDLLDGDDHALMDEQSLPPPDQFASTDGTEVVGGSGDDVLAGGDFIEGGSGRDLIDAGIGADVVYGGSGDDRISGGPGRDGLDGDDGADEIRGGDGSDYAGYGPYIPPRGPVSVTLDDLANDGAPGEGDNVASDVEDVIDLNDEPGSALQSTYIGNEQRNRLASKLGEDYLDGRSGIDRLSAGSARDTVRARDGLADRVRCGPNVDFAIVDPVDTPVGCERVDTGVDNRPRPGLDFVAAPSAEVQMRLPRTRRFVPLADRVNLPLGAEVELAGQELEVSFAIGPRGAGTPLTVSGGAFTVHPAGDGVEMRLADGAPPVSGARYRRKRRGFRVRGHCRRRRCSVRGNDSINSGIGTDYTVEDRCDGTLTTVAEGAVRVFDLGRRRTITVHAGGSYLARASRSERRECEAG